MATASYSFTLPTVGASSNTWGASLNANWEKIDDLLDGTLPIDGIDIVGGTLDSVVITGGSVNAVPIGGDTPSTGAFTALSTDTTLTVGTLLTALNALLNGNNPTLSFSDSNSDNTAEIQLTNNSLRIEVDNLAQVTGSLLKLFIDNAEVWGIDAAGDVTATGNITTTGGGDFTGLMTLRGGTTVTGAISGDTVAGNMLATQVEAEAGAATNKVMSPLRVKEAIAAFASTPQEWEPYDSVAGDWTADGDGVLYDGASDGTVAIVTSPASTDEYEYVIEADGLEHNGAGARNLLQRVTYSDTTTEDTALYNNVPVATAVSGRADIGSHNPIFFLSSDVSTKRVSQVSLVFSSDSISAGVVRVWRRRAAFVTP